MCILAILRIFTATGFREGAQGDEGGAEGRVSDPRPDWGSAWSRAIY